MNVMKQFFGIKKSVYTFTRSTKLKSQAGEPEKIIKEMKNKTRNETEQTNERICEWNIEKWIMMK